MFFIKSLLSNSLYNHNYTEKVFQHHFLQKKKQHFNKIFQLPKNPKVTYMNSQFNNFKPCRNHANIRSTKYLSLFGFNKPFLFVKKCRLHFLYYYFFKKNEKTFSFIVNSFKKVKPFLISNYFTQTLGFILSSNFIKSQWLSFPNNYNKLVLVNNVNTTNLWFNISIGDIIQLMWSNKFLFSIVNRRKRNFLSNQSFFSSSSPIKPTTFMSIKGLVDYRSNTMFTLNSYSNLSTLNQNNWHTFSTYNWKIVT